MSKKFLISALVIFFVLNSVVFALVADKNFTDEDKFDSWYSKEVQKLYEQRIITGYKDGSFKPNNNITRAENAVITSKAYDDLIEQFEEVLVSYEELSNVKFDLQGDGTPKIALAMAIARLKKLENFKPEELSKIDFVKLKGENIPHNYDVYQLTSLPTYLYYVHWVADEAVPESGDSTKLHIDEWYGPFEPSVWFNN